jgi:hypothetical protein
MSQLLLYQRVRLCANPLWFDLAAGRSLLITKQEREMDRDFPLGLSIAPAVTRNNSVESDKATAMFKDGLLKVTR